VAEEMRELERELTILMVNEKEKAMEKLKMIGGNVFLLYGLNFAVLREIDEAFSKELMQPEAGGGCGGGWVTFDTYGSDFDSSCSADSSDSGSGCSSGDSGCGGGCGGCGGD